ncbi:nuclear transport factor 2 family protein [Rhodococcus qingshengii]|uniref:nuclear transport factor 2 family protein n=1 Tax=Rhodococcus qingshengii TaxID=334542 RepID=UPI0010A65407|nr:nuclear transport factor 2 family protein [Rhodococcus qingshengii]THJ67670.1 hypothetical protein EU244_26115 [Rhodococcus qingshengii]
MTLDLRHIASMFYDAVAGGDVPALREVVSSSFAEDAWLRRPESLPGGGVCDGRDHILAFMEKAVGKVPLVVRAIDVNGAGTEAYAHIEITLGETSTSALEWWSYAGGQVVSVKAFYWDTAAMVGAG